MIGTALWATVGAALGWAGGHLALLVPAGRLSPLSGALAGLRRERRLEHQLGAVLAAVSLGLAYNYRSSTADIFVTAAFLLLLIPILIIDLRHHLVYPLMPIAGFFVGLVLNPIAGEVTSTSSMYGGVAGALAFLALFLIGLVLFRVQALGFGDVLLAGMIGGMVGLEHVLNALFLGTMLGAVAAIVLLAIKRKGTQDYLPFGSGMCLAAMAILIVR